MLQYPRVFWGILRVNEIMTNVFILFGKRANYLTQIIEQISYMTDS